MIELTLLCAVGAFAVLAAQKMHWRVSLKLGVAIGIAIAISLMVYAIYYQSMGLYSLTFAARTRQVLEQLIPSVVFGVVAGYFFFRATMSPSWIFVIAAGVSAVAPVVLGLALSLNRYVQEIRTPWIEAKLVADPRPASVSAGLNRFLDRSAGSDLNPKAYAFLIDQLCRDQQISLLLRGAPRGTVPSSAETTRRCAASPSHPDSMTDSVDGVGGWVNNVVEPLLLCAWRLQRSSGRDDELIRRALRPVAYAGSNLLYTANRFLDSKQEKSALAAWDIPSRINAFKVALESAVNGLEICRDSGGTSNAVLEAEFVTNSQTAAEMGLAGKRIKLPSGELLKEPISSELLLKIARSPLPYIIFSRMLRLTDNDEIGFLLLKDLKIEQIEQTSLLSIYSERAGLELMLDKDNWDSDLQTAIRTLEKTLELINRHVAPDEEWCDEEADDSEPHTPAIGLYAVVEYELTQMRNHFSFEIISRSLKRSSDVSIDAFDRAKSYARLNYDVSDAIAERKCVIEDIKKKGDIKFEFNLKPVLADTYALSLLASTMRERQRSPEVIKQAREVLEEGLFDAGNLDELEEVRDVINQHLDAIDLMM